MRGWLSPEPALEPTALGRRMLEPGSLGALQAQLFRALFWRTDLSLFMGWLFRRVPGRWQQHDIGPIRWALSSVVGEWHGADTLVVSCTDPETPAPHGLIGWPAPLFASRVLVPLCWFGVMEWREIQDMHDVRRWRKTALFDRMMSFDVRLADGRPGRALMVAEKRESGGGCPRGSAGRPIRSDGPA